MVRLINLALIQMIKEQLKVMSWVVWRREEFGKNYVSIGLVNIDSLTKNLLFFIVPPIKEGQKAFGFDGWFYLTSPLRPCVLYCTGMFPLLSLEVFSVHWKRPGTV